jgi:excisionase family DNA binding protein
MQDTTKPAFMRPSQAAKYLGVHPRTVRLWQQKRLIPFAKIGARVALFKVSDLEAFVDNNRAEV